jgi:hypothetical protein
MKLITMQFSLFSCYFLPTRPKYLPQHLPSMQFDSAFFLVLLHAVSFMHFFFLPSNW